MIYIKRALSRLQKLKLPRKMAHGNRKERTKASQRLKVAEDSRDDRLGYLGSPIITIVVGGDMGLVHEFHIHKDLLMRNSDYFKGTIFPIISISRSHYVPARLTGRKPSPPNG